VDLVPEIASGLGVDACRGLVEQQQARAVDEASGQRQPLLPTPRELAGELALARCQSQSLERAIDLGSALRQFEQPGDEVQVLADRQVLVEAEALCHVADLALDRRGFANDVQPQAGAAAAVGFEQAAEHSQGGGLAAAVGSEEAADPASLELQVELVDHRPAVVALAQTAHRDGGRPVASAHGAARRTSSG